MARRVLAVAIALSLAIHGAALWEWWQLPQPITPEVNASARVAPLTAQLTPALREPEAAPPPPSPPSVPRVTPAPRTKPPVLLAERSSAPPIVTPEIAAVPAPTPPQPLPMQPPAPTPVPIAPPIAQAYPDLSSYIAAKRRARGESESGSSSPSEDEKARRNKIVTANLASINTPTFGADTRSSGGMFQITQLNLDSAEFTFFGWNRDIRRRASQRIDVRRGEHGDIRVAVVRRMIAIIREYEQEDFTWRSNRLGRDVTLSARASDNEGLEQFMLREFFDLRRAPG